MKNIRNSMPSLKTFVLFCSCLLCLANLAFAEPKAEDFLGNWVMIPRESTNIDLFGTASLEFQAVSEDRVLFTQRWGTTRSRSESFDLELGGARNEFPIDHKAFASNVFMGLRFAVGETRSIRANWEKPFRSLHFEERYPILSSQGRKEFTSQSTFSLNEHGTILTWTIQRPTRPADQPLVFKMKREGYREAYTMDMVADWEIDGLLPEQAALITLQGVVNEEAPLLYFIYPETWDFRFTDEIAEFYEERKQFTFKKLRSLKHALQTFSDQVDRYIVWDKKERTSLIVAFTLAGLEDAIVVSEDEIPLMEELGLEMIEDYRGRFTGQSDFEIYTWAYEEYWDRCSKDYIVWMGGEHGTRM